MARKEKCCLCQKWKKHQEMHQAYFVSVSKSYIVCQDCKKSKNMYELLPKLELRFLVKKAKKLIYEK